MVLQPVDQRGHGASTAVASDDDSIDRCARDIIELAADLNLDPEATASTFRDYWAAIPGAKGRKTDWPATWRNWCRRDADNRRTPARGGAGIRPSAIRDESSAFARAADILAGR